MDDNNYVGNITTIVKIISMPLAGWVIAWALSKGFNLPISQQELAEIIGMIIFFVIGYIDARRPNTLKWLGNANLVDMGTILGYPSEEVVLNDEYTIAPDDPGEAPGDGC